MQLCFCNLFRKEGFYTTLHHWKKFPRLTGQTQISYFERKSQIWTQVKQFRKISLKKHICSFRGSWTDYRKTTLVQKLYFYNTWMTANWIKKTLKKFRRYKRFFLLRFYLWNLLFFFTSFRFQNAIRLLHQNSLTSKWEIEKPNCVNLPRSRTR